jgi:RNA polymerase sigma-70 factor (ECF subfamily)
MQTGIALTAAAPSRSWIASKDASDVALIGQIAAGDRNAMRVLYARHNVRVFRFIRRMVGNEAVAEELVSEVFFDVWRQAGRFEARSQVSTWILGIARFKALSSLRQRKEEELDDDLARSIEDGSDTPEMVAEKNDQSAILRRCMMQLSPAHREIIDLVYYHEKTVQETVAIIGIPENTVKTRMFYARKRLAELLKEAGIERGFA